jgi:long-subunit acyl-CoA synthetase (AMP-forming)
VCPTGHHNLSAEDILNRCTWQGQTVMVDNITVMDPESMQPVPADGTTMGEVMIRGNIMMKGYFKNPGATQEAFDKGWFHTGDLAVSHGNGRFEIKDRSKGQIFVYSLSKSYVLH